MMIRIYSSPKCSPCHALMEWLDSEGIEYEEVQDREQSMKNGVSHYPTVEMDGVRFHGNATECRVQIRKILEV